MLPAFVVALAAALMAASALAACGAQSGQPLATIHADAGWDSSATGDGSCLECHDLATITGSTEDYDGLVGVSIHEPPTEDHPTASCISCHRVEEAPILTCNQTACHAYTLPEGWVAQD